MKRLIPYLALAALLSGCGIGSRTHDVVDVTKSETIILKKNPRQGLIARDSENVITQNKKPAWLIKIPSLLYPRPCDYNIEHR
ncbi:MAG: hypothetical protein ABIH24_04395 [Verrucomicrobiota bacterium]